MKIISPLAFFCMLLLSACASLSQEQQADAVTTPSTSSTHYGCESGEVIAATYLSTDAVTIQYKGSAYSMQSAVSGSGARYVGGSLEWWTKGSGIGAYGSLVHHNTDGTSGDTIEICAES